MSAFGTKPGISPFLDANGVPLCDDQCPSHDGKRCSRLGRRPTHICEPAVASMVARVEHFERQAHGQVIVVTDTGRIYANTGQRRFKVVDEISGTVLAEDTTNYRLVIREYTGRTDDG